MRLKYVILEQFCEAQLTKPPLNIKKSRKEAQNKPLFHFLGAT